MTWKQSRTLSFVGETQKIKAEGQRRVEEKQTLIQAKSEVIRRRANAADQGVGRAKRVIDKRMDRLSSLKSTFRRECRRLKDTPPGYRETPYEALVNYADGILIEAGQTLEEIERWTDSREWLLANEAELEELHEMCRKEEEVMEIRDFVRTEMEQISNFILRQLSQQLEPEPEPKTAEQAMEEMARLSDALEEAKKKAKDAVDYEKSTAKMSIAGSAGLGLLSVLIISSSLSGFLPGLALIISVVGTIFLSLSFVGASSKAKQVEEQWGVNIEVWENDLAKATNEWLKLEGIYDFSNPEIP